MLDNTHFMAHIRPHRFSSMLYLSLVTGLCLGLFPFHLHAADSVPPAIEMPGTQPDEVPNLESPDKCDNCHSGYSDTDPDTDPEEEPATGWRGGAMGNAGRDPIFWATMAIAEQDFDGSGDLCIRCHSTGGWYAGRSSPTDGSGLADNDSDGVDCDACHSMTDPDNSDPLLQGVMNAPYIASKNGEGFYGSGMLSLWSGGDKLGPYDPSQAKHNYLQSRFHRDVDYCGSCHDVSNPVVGDLAPGNGAQPGAPPVIASGALDSPLTDKAAFNNPPYAYGIVERTFSEYKASAMPTTLVSDFDTLPSDLKVAGGSLQLSHEASLAAGRGGNYEDGTQRYFSCQTCHMRPTIGKGAKQATRVRKDLPLHDHTGGNYWMADIIKYQDARDQLRLGGDLTATQIDALERGQVRATQQLRQAAMLEVSGNTLKVINLTGHKLITGYPEGRRMWLNIRWYGASSSLLREDGAYGPLVDGDGNPVKVMNPAGGPDVQVESILNLDDPNTRIYKTHDAMTQEWASKLLDIGKSPNLVLSFNRYTGVADFTLGNLASQAAGSHHETFHFVLNNLVASDNRIPPYRLRYDEAKRRNVLPVPATQYGDPGAGGVYNYWDDVSLNPPSGAVRAEIDLLYQGTSWEYIQFLNNANNGQHAFLGQEGVDMLEAWINADVQVAVEVAGDRKMVPPVVMASANWSSPETSGRRLYTIEPCRLADTRVAGGKIPATGTRNFKVWGDDAVIQGQGGAGDCGIPSSAQAVVVNITSNQPDSSGHFRVFPYGISLPLAAMLNFSPGLTIGNASTVSVCYPLCTFELNVYSSSASHLIIDAVGWME